MTITGADLALFERSLRHATETTSGPGLDAALRDLGWHDALADDPRSAVALLFELQGRAGATSSALDAVLAGALGVDGGGPVVLPPLGSVEPPGRLTGDDLHVAGLVLPSLVVADAAIIASDAGTTTASAAALRQRTVTGLDPALGLVVVSGTMASSPIERPGGWADALAIGQLALAHELVGASRAMLELARVHATERIQFDQPIARFQAVRHRLAESLVAIEAAADAAAAAWEDGTPFAASAAKAIAGRGARVVAKHCQQVLAGIGFTTEHPLHTYVRRVLTLDRLLGDSKALTRAMGEELLRARRVPPMLPL